jgi:ABC-type nitrate/sulfonate/bicarbonate transport system substrate-binding protein
MVMLDRVRVLAAIAALTACGEICTGANAAAQNLQAVSVIAFPGTGNWPIRIAQDKGYFVQAGIEVTLTPTPNSVFQMTNLIEGKFDIAMTAVDNVIAYAPFDLIANANGFNVLQYAKDVYGHYEESVAVARRAWAQDNGQKLIAYSKAYVAAVEWLRDPINKEEAISILRKYFPELSPELAAATYANFTGPRGIAAKAQLDIAGIGKVLELRSEYGQPKKTLSDPSRYYDLRYYEAAIH